MPRPNPARSGGARTASGLKAASRNAVKHGLSVAGPATEAEAAVVSSLRSALVAQYSPQNALEALQIDRIARAAAKLQRLHEIEEAAFRLAQENAFPPVAEMVAAMGPSSAEVQADAVRILQGQAPAQPLDLDDATLAQMCDEIRAARDKVTTYADLQTWMPATHAFVAQSCERNGTSDPALQFQALIEGLRPLPPSPRLDPAMPVTSMTDGELQAAIRGQESKLGVVSVPIRPQDDLAAQVRGLQEDLDALLRQQLHRLEVDELVQRYPGRRALLQQAALPPAEDADRLMRYQVALDRQLSKCMGELLQMIAMRPSQTPCAGP